MRSREIRANRCGIRESGISFARHYVGPFCGVEIARGGTEGPRTFGVANRAITIGESIAAHLDNCRPIRSEAAIGTLGDPETAFLKDGE